MVAVGADRVQGGGVEDEWTEVGEWASLAAADEHALVVLAMSADCRVSPKEAGFALEVEPDRAAAARLEIDEYAKEQAGAGAVFAPRPRSVVAGWLLAAVWVLVLAWVHARRPAGGGWIDRWSNDIQRVWGEGEYWRAFTALFLHADLGHLLGNVIIGGAFCVMVGAVFGAARGWFLILLAGTLGNLLGGFLHQWADEGGFRSIGASTATFGALGLLVGGGLVRAWRERSYGRLKSLVVPLGAGAALFGMFGAGGVDTDVVGHLAGWLCGLSTGLLVAACETADPMVAIPHEGRNSDASVGASGGGP